MLAANIIQQPRQTELSSLEKIYVFLSFAASVFIGSIIQSEPSVKSFTKSVSPYIEYLLRSCYKLISQDITKRELTENTKKLFDISFFLMPLFFFGGCFFMLMRKAEKGVERAYIDANQELQTTIQAVTAHANLVVGERAAEAIGRANQAREEAANVTRIYNMRIASMQDTAANLSTQNDDNSYNITIVRSVISYHLENLALYPKNTEYLLAQAITPGLKKDMVTLRQAITRCLPSIDEARKEALAKDLQEINALVNQEDISRYNLKGKSRLDPVYLGNLFRLAALEYTLERNFEQERVAPLPEPTSALRSPVGRRRFQSGFAEALSGGGSGGHSDGRG